MACARGLIIVLLLLATVVAEDIQTWTTDADFQPGIVNNLVTVSDSLQLAPGGGQSHVLWVAVSSKNTIVKVFTDTAPPTIAGEYRCAPSNSGHGNPSRTTVDSDGNVWFGNRNGGSIVKIGFYRDQDNHNCVDRNNDGIIQTSGGLDDIYDWTDRTDINTALDECILVYYEDPINTDVRHVSVDEHNDVYFAGRNRKFWRKISSDGATITDYDYSQAGGYGGLYRNGIIWSTTSGSVLRWDTQTQLPSEGLFLNPPGYQYGVCADSQNRVWITHYGQNNFWRFNPDGTYDDILNQGYYRAQGCAVDQNDHVWIAHSLNGGVYTVGHVNPDGDWLGNVQVGEGPTGVSVGTDGKIYVTNYLGRSISRIDPTLNGGIGGEDWRSTDLGGSPYDYSDMTGSSLVAGSTVGKWEELYDTGEAGTCIDVIEWTASPQGGSVLVEYSVSEDSSAFPPLVPATNGFPALTCGRYIRVVVTLARDTAQDPTPIFEDLTLRSDGTDPGTVDGDPHFHAFHGGEYDVMGEPGKVFNIYTSPSLQVNGRFIQYPDDDATYIGEVGVRTHSGTLFLDTSGMVVADPWIPADGTGDHFLGEGASFSYENQEARLMMGEWVIRINRMQSLPAGHLHLDVSLSSLSDELPVEEVLPHGLLGQTARLPPGEPCRSTGHQGEGVIEGTYTDYMLMSDDIFGKDFLFNLFEE